LTVYQSFNMSRLFLSLLLCTLLFSVIDAHAVKPTTELLDRLKQPLHRHARPVKSAVNVPHVKRIESVRHVDARLDTHEGSMRDAELLVDPIFKVKSAIDCAQLCIDTQGCEAWNYDEIGCQSNTQSTCTLHSSRGKVSGAALCHSSGAPNATLLAPAYPRLPITAVKPTGWLRRELELQNAGLAGHLQLFYPDVADSEFIGGHHDLAQTNHERFAYWLNAQISMGYLTDDASMSQQVYNFTQILLNNQSADGFLGPRENLDPWPRMLILYIFQQYNEINQTDPRVIPAMFNYLQFVWNQYTAPGYNPQSYMWTYVRIEDLMTSIAWLYDNYGVQYKKSQFLLDLYELVYNKSWDWKKYYRTQLPKKDVGPHWNYYDHGVNNGQAIKSSAMWYRASADPDDQASSHERMNLLDEYHGQASGIFSCDECLAGLNPSRGTELCTVVEAMFSYEMTFSVFGEPVFADKVEQIAFNALPASMTRDLWAHQYLQQSNEINSMHQNSPWWNTDGGDSNIYGLDPNYACCTVNHGQGWPKYTASMWLLAQTEKSTGLLSALLGPSVVSVTVDDPTYGANAITVHSETDYPLVADPTIVYVMQADHPFPLSIRIPGWAVNASITTPDGQTVPVQNGTIYVYQYKPQASAAWTKLTLNLISTWRSQRRFNDAISVYYGPLLMALDFSYNVTVLNKHPYQSADYQYLPISNWNYAIQIDESDLSKSLNVTKGKIGTFPFDPLAPTITATAYAREIDWPMAHDSADVPPQSPVKSDKPLVPITLIPYGASMLRIAEIPVLAN